MKYLPTSETADLVSQLFSSEKAYTAQRFQISSLQMVTMKDSDMKSNTAVNAGCVCVCVCVCVWGGGGGLRGVLGGTIYMNTSSKKKKKKK